jgi:putative endonuclease
MNYKNWVAYLVRCSDRSLYCGISNDLKNRLIEHNSGKGAKYTRSRRPVELVGVSSELSKSEALQLEYRIKQLPADRKIPALKGKEKTVKQDLKSLQKEFKALGKKVEKLIKAVEKNEKALR